MKMSYRKNENIGIYTFVMHYNASMSNAIERCEKYFESCGYKHIDIVDVKITKTEPETIRIDFFIAIIK